jgi:hypothetical protein
MDPVPSRQLGRLALLINSPAISSSPLAVAEVYCSRRWWAASSSYHLRGPVCPRVRHLPVAPRDTGNSGHLALLLLLAQVADGMAGARQQRRRQGRRRRDAQPAGGSGRPLGCCRRARRGRGVGALEGGAAGGGAATAGPSCWALVGGLGGVVACEGRQVGAACQQPTQWRREAAGSGPTPACCCCCCWAGTRQRCRQQLRIAHACMPGTRAARQATRAALTWPRQPAACRLAPPRRLGGQRPEAGLRAAGSSQPAGSCLGAGGGAAGRQLQWSAAPLAAAQQAGRRPTSSAIVITAAAQPACAMQPWDKAGQAQCKAGAHEAERPPRAARARTCPYDVTSLAVLQPRASWASAGAAS